MMADELPFHVSGSTANRAAPMSLVEAGLREGQHLQEWLLANPDVIGADMVVVTSRRVLPPVGPEEMSELQPHDGPEVLWNS